MLDDCMSSNRMFVIGVLDNQKTEKGWACPVNVGTLVYIFCFGIDIKYGCLPLSIFFHSK